MLVLLRASSSVLLLITIVSCTVHHPYVFDRFNDFSDNDFKIVFPDQVKQQSSTLMLVNVLFRHGNRTADSKAELYPKDPYLNETYFPYGLGQLTNAGKRREYNVGTSLRRRYDSFLGEYYYPEIIEAISTDYNRTKMSLQLALAGLFPPRSEDMFVPFLWQPVPFNYMPRSDDRVLLGVLCPRYLKLYEQYSKSNDMQAKFRTYQQTFNYIARNSGLNVRGFQDIYQLYFGLSTETEYGFTLPSWLDSVWPETVVKLSIEEYFVSMGTSNLRKMATGYFLRKVLNDSQAKIQSPLKLGRKMHVYSAHENNIAQLLIALGVFEPHIPNYGAYVMMELHKINNVYGFKIFYDNWTGNGPQQLIMRGCDSFCPLDKFISLVDEHLPIDNDLCGN